MAAGELGRKSTVTEMPFLLSTGHWLKLIFIIADVLKRDHVIFYRLWDKSEIGARGRLFTDVQID